MKRLLIAAALIAALITQLQASTITAYIQQGGGVYQVADSVCCGDWDTLIVRVDNSTATEFFCPSIYLVDSGGTDSAVDTLVMRMYPLPDKSSSSPVWNETRNSMAGLDTVYSVDWTTATMNNPIQYPGFVNSSGTTLDSTIIWTHGSWFYAPSFTVPASKAWMFVYRNFANGNGACLMVFSIVTIRK